jgi:hypothetical protein
VIQQASSVKPLMSASMSRLLNARTWLRIAAATSVSVMLAVCRSQATPGWNIGCYLPKASKSPFRTPPRKACHSSGVNARTGPVTSLLLRMPIVPPGRLATSTQLPLA